MSPAGGRGEGGGAGRTKNHLLYHAGSKFVVFKLPYVFQEGAGGLARVGTSELEADEHLCGW